MAKMVKEYLFPNGSKGLVLETMFLHWPDSCDYVSPQQVGSCRMPTVQDPAKFFGGADFQLDKL